MEQRNTLEPEAVTGLLRKHGINPTSQRVEIARLLFSRREHLSAEDFFARINRHAAQASKDTVYNTLGLFAEVGLVREVIADPSRVFYDSNVEPHHHIYNRSTGELLDIPASNVNLGELPQLPDGMELEGIDIIVRVRSTPQSGV